jgi:predicted HicB family RNase H-like nuclease
MKPYKGYLAGLYVDEEEAIIRGKVLNTRDTITFYGKTVEEALQAFRDSVDDYLDFCKEAGVEPDKPFNGKLLVRIKPEHHRDLSLIAQEEGRSINAVVAQLVAKAIRMHGKRAHPAPIAPSGDERSSMEQPRGRAASKSPPRAGQDPPAPGSRKRVKAQ